MRCFVHFDFQMCISPQRHAILRHLNRQKWSKHAVFCTFWLSNVHFATAACNFSTSCEQTKVLQGRHVLYIFTCECAFRHSFVQFFDIWNRQKCSKAVMFCTFWLSNVLFATAACNFWFRLWALTSAPAALTGLLFRLTQQTNHWKNTPAFRDFSNIWRGCIFFLLTFRAIASFVDWLGDSTAEGYASAFQLSILSEVSI